MYIEQFVFFILALITLLSGWFVVTDRNLFHAALAMMLTFLGVAGLYVLLDSGFLAATQLLVYIGAISILIIFAIMMTRRLMKTTEPAYNSMWQGALLISVFSGAGLVYVIVQVFGMSNYLQKPDTSDAVLNGTVVTLGEWLVSADHLVIPFEVASVLLLAALIGSIVIARAEK
ncbi:MAG TPA: NADH-quinone oxidoreductase subunit J [Anaerolineae bacterium]|nr:NADH-quinone oxidoreductase subunit J [Anaerolineae bacterium]